MHEVHRQLASQHLPPHVVPARFCCFCSKCCVRMSGWLVRACRNVQVCWAKDGDRVAACFSNRVVSVLDLRT